MSKRVKQKNVFYLACDKNGEKYLFDLLPHREENIWMYDEGNCYPIRDSYLIESLLPEITWNDEPKMIVINSNIYNI